MVKTPQISCKALTCELGFGAMIKTSNTVFCQAARRFHITVFWLVSAFMLLTSLALTQIVIAQELKPISIRYTVSFESEKYGSATLGRFETQLSQAKDGGYRIKSALQGQGIAAILMGSNYQESCDFSIENGRAISNDYAGGRKALEDYQVKFDWTERLINFSDGESLDMPKGYVVDNCNMFFAAALLKGEGLSEQPLYIVDGKNKRIRGYNLRSTTNEILSTNFGDINTLKIVLERELQPDRTISLWLAPENSYMPLKMEERRRKRTTTMIVDQINN
ncbi:MAG: hypothetical protein ACI9WC_000218 [Arenicella sp.]|jgi:hypothetical protein